MTNVEKYKTAQERAEAFRKWCKSHYNADVCFSAVRDHNCSRCGFAWLDLEADEEKPLPCPFCGCKCESVDFSDYAEGGQVICENCDYQSRGYETVEKAIAAHNRVAKAVRESEGK